MSALIVVIRAMAISLGIFAPDAVYRSGSAQNASALLLHQFHRTFALNAETRVASWMFHATFPTVVDRDIWINDLYNSYRIKTN